MTVLKVLVLLVCSPGLWCQDCDRTRVYFESRNFHSVLRWDEVEVPGGAARYSVAYHEYGKPSQPHPECQNISEASCDLSSVMTNIHMRHFAKVMVGGVCVGQVVGFVLFEQTALDSPCVSVAEVGSSLRVTLALPAGPRQRSIGEVSCWESGAGRNTPPVVYIVHLTEPESESRRVYSNTSDTITVNYVKQGARYCGVAMYQLTHPVARRVSDNSTFCLTIAAAGVPWVPLVVGAAAAVALCVLGGTALVLCQLYVRRKRNMPKALIMSRSPCPRLDLALDAELQISGVCVCPPPPRIKDAQGSYAAQGVPAYTNQHGARAVPVEVAPCTSYSTVVGVMVPLEDPEESDSGVGRSLDAGSDPPTPELDLGLGGAVLPVCRAADGTLEFFGLVFRPLLQGVSHDDAFEPPAAASTPASEALPLLAELVLGDPGPDYAGAYLRGGVPEPVVGVASDSTSHYRQNWVPGMRPDPPPKRPDEVREFLDTWAVRIRS